MEKEYETADICEEAHIRTELDCKKKDIELDTIDENNCVIYTDEAQKIFNKHFNEVEQEFEKELIEYQTKEKSN